MPLKSCRERKNLLRTASEFTRSGTEPIRNKSYAQHQIVLPFNNASVSCGRWQESVSRSGSRGSLRSLTCCIRSRSEANSVRPWRISAFARPHAVAASGVRLRTALSCVPSTNSRSPQVAGGRFHHDAEPGPRGARGRRPADRHRAAPSFASATAHPGHGPETNQTD